MSHGRPGQRVIVVDIPICYCGNNRTAKVRFLSVFQNFSIRNFSFVYLLGVVVDENISRVAWNKRVSKVYDVSFSGLRIEKFSNHSLAVTDMILFVGLMNYPYFCKELIF